MILLVVSTNMVIVKTNLKLAQKQRRSPSYPRGWLEIGSWILNIEWSSTMLTTVFPLVKEYLYPLGDATQDILNFALLLAQQKRRLSKKEYRQLLRNYKWEHEDKVYLKIAEIFHQFPDTDLAAIEPNTLFVLAKHHKKYATVISELLSSGEINNETVRRLIKKHRKPKMSKEDKPSIWRRTPQGARYVQIPPIHNENTGVVLQEMIESEGLLPQQIISEAVSLREAFLQGRLAWVSDSQELSEVIVEKAMCDESVRITEEISNFDIEDNDGCDDIDLNSSRVISSNYECDRPEVECLVNTPESLSKRLFDIVENIHRRSKQQVVEASQLVREIIDYCNQKPVSSQWEMLAAITRRNGDALSIVINYLGELHRFEFFNLPQILALAALKNPLELDWVSEKLRDKAVELMSVNLLQEVQQKVLLVGDKVNLKKCPPHLSSWQPFVVASIQGEFAMLEYYQHPVAIVDLDLIDT